MANVMYGPTRQVLNTGGLNLSTAAIHVTAVDLADYTPSFSSHAFYSSIPAPARVATFGPLTGKTVTLGVVDANDYEFPTVVGDQFEALIYWVNTGSEATSRLLWFVDTNAAGSPISVTPNSGNIAVVINAAGIGS